MRTARVILLGVVILAGPVIVFCVLGVLPFDYVSWLGGGIVGMVVAMAIPGIACIATLNIARWRRAIAAIFYVTLYTPLCLFPGFLAACTIIICHA